MRITKKLMADEVLEKIMRVCPTAFTTHVEERDVSRAHELARGPALEVDTVIEDERITEDRYYYLDSSLLILPRRLSYATIQGNAKRI